MRQPRNPRPFDALVGVLAIATVLTVIGFAGAPRAATEPVVGVAEATKLLSDEPLLVLGELVAPSDGPRLCQKAGTRACAGPSLCVRGLDPHVAGRLAARSTSVAVVLRGVVGAGVLDLGTRPREPLRTTGCDSAGAWGTGDVPAGGGGGGAPVLE